MMDDYASLRKEIENLENNNHCLENKIKEPRNGLYSMTIKNETLHKELHITKMEVAHNMRWTRSSIMLDSIQKGQSSTRHDMYSCEEDYESFMGDYDRNSLKIIN
ncbi:hypothetical protein H5410_062252 [Solanum commersonii]|uniref:Uncharacterized protein n=1 Tax=Solanum commersonii TaxID=4109 RepID=A0A9J5WC27_SOLCO|nr:hypothetical protein H5410_062252 [Solanum commersonii]